MTGEIFMPGTKPEAMPRAKFLALLADLAATVADDDSMEGQLTYEWGDERGTYNVAGFIRTGNSQGQGGAIVIGGYEQ